MKDGLFTFIFFMIFVMICVGLSVTADSTRCKEIGKVLNYKTEWNYWSGCVVTKPDGNKVLLKQMRDTER